MTTLRVLEAAAEIARRLETLDAADRERVIELLLDDSEPSGDFERTIPSPETMERPRAEARPEITLKPSGVVSGRARELVQHVADLGGTAKTPVLCERMKLSAFSVNKYRNQAIEAGYLVQTRRGEVTLNPDPSAPVVVADRSKKK